MNLGALLDRLRASGIVIDDGPVVFSVARELKIQQGPGRPGGRFLRVLDRAKGERDFANLKFLRDRLGERINGPSQTLASGDLVCGVFPFIAHHKVSYDRLASGDRLREIAESLVLLHEAGGEYLRTMRAPASPVDFVPESEGSSADSATTAWLRATLRQQAARKPPVAQHCDFTYANLALSNDGRLVIFDWEEYGAVTCPAFDLTTFLLGHYHFGGEIGRALDSPAALLEMVTRDFGGAFLGRFGMNDGEYAEAFPAYLILFWLLKSRGFSVAINRRMQTMWSRLRRSEEWSRAMAARGVSGWPGPANG